MRNMAERAQDESGATIIEFLACIPIMLLLVCALLDVTTLLVTYSQAHAAATSAARTVLADPSISDDDLKGAALSDAPALSSDDITVTSEKGEVDGQGYTHHYNDSFDNNRYVFWQPSTVKVEVARSYVTPVLASADKALGGDGKMHVTASATVDMDITDGQSWQGPR